MSISLFRIDETTANYRSSVRETLQGLQSKTTGESYLRCYTFVDSIQLSHSTPHQNVSGIYKGMYKCIKSAMVQL